MTRSNREYRERMIKQRLNSLPEIDITVESKPESISLQTEESIRKSLKVAKEHIETKPVVEFKSNIGILLGDLKENDPEQVKTILSWYKKSGFSLNNDITTCTKQYRNFLTNFGRMCYNDKIVIGDQDTTGFLVIGSYHTGDIELRNIAKAYIHLAYYNQDINNEVKMNHEVLTSQFNKATLKLDETYEYLRNANKP